jgi:hypothetical protein
MGENGRQARERRPEWEHPYPDPADHNERGTGSKPGDGVLARWMAEGAGRRGEQRNGYQPAASGPESSLAESPANSPSPGQPQPSAEGQQPAPLGTGRLPTPRPRPGPGQLAPEHRALVDRIMAACRVAEGQNPRGGYGSSGLTPALRRIAAQLPAGGLAPDSEADTLKSADRFGAKLSRLITRQPGRPAAELAACISDAIRYAFTFEAADYTESTLLVHRKLKAQGFDLEARRNCWDSPEYKGIFTRWRDPAHGLSFEVQFHSVESWAVIKRTRDAYLRITDPVTPAAERARLRARQVTAASAVQVPHGCLDIADFRAETR